MGLIRTLFYLIIGTLIWLAIRNFLRKQELARQQREQQAQSDKPLSARIVKCEHCSLHLPETEAICYKEQWFCSPAHMERWLEQHDSQRPHV